MAYPGPVPPHDPAHHRRAAPDQIRPGPAGPGPGTHTVHDGAILIDTRPESQRRADGEMPGAIIIERNHLEWRCDPASPARIPEATGHHVKWIICCDHGYSSSLAAASLQTLGLSSATDVIGGFQAWRAAGLPVATPGQPSRPRRP